MRCKMIDFTFPYFVILPFKLDSEPGKSKNSLYEK